MLWNISNILAMCLQCVSGSVPSVLYCKIKRQRHGFAVRGAQGKGSYSSSNWCISYL